jgi:uncharacterized protein YndB with AHSA1/START domain
MMPVKKDASGRRYVQAEVEVPGTPEAVWQAIATGPGISSWFVPTTSEERVGGEKRATFGPGMDSSAVITEWEPPRRFVIESRRDDLGPNSPAVATEWVVEARSGGTCTVRVVHSWFASTDDWDNQFEGVEHGWPSFFRILRLYLTHFAGKPGSQIQLIAMDPGPMSKAWDALVAPLGLAGAVEAQRVTSPAGAPRLAGIVERVGSSEHPEMLVRLDLPAPGIAHLLGVPMGGSICLAPRLYFYGDNAPAIVAREEPVWQAWFNERFPPASDASPVSQESH